MRILFVLHHAGVTPFARTLGLLAGRGHQVHVAFKRVKTAESARDLKQLADEHPGITFGHVPGGRPSEWDPFARKLRATIDYLRYLEPRYRDAEKLRARAERNAPAAGKRLAGMARAAGTAGRRRRAGHAPGGRALPAIPGRAPPPPRRARLRPAADHTADRAGLVAERLAPRRQTDRHPHRLSGAELGQPDEQGAPARRARPGLRLERGAGRRGGRAARGSPRPGRGHRCAAVRPLVRVGAEPVARGALRRGRAARRPPVRRLRLLVRVRRPGASRLSSAAGSPSFAPTAVCSPTRGSSSARTRCSRCSGRASSWTTRAR